MELSLPISDKHQLERPAEDAGLSRDELRQKYGRSVFYDCLDASPTTTTTEATTPTEKQDDMKPDTENTNTEDDRE